MVSREIRTALDATLERKCSEGTGAFTCTYAGTIINATANLSQGDAAINQCTGVLIKPRRLVLRYEITQAAAATTNLVRVIVFRWHSEGVPVPSGILNNNSTAYAPLGFLYWVNHRKILVLYDRLHKLYDHGGAVDIETGSADINPGRLPIQLPLSGSGATPQMDGLFILFVSDDGLAPSPLVDYNYRLEFTDA